MAEIDFKFPDISASDIGDQELPSSSDFNIVLLSPIAIKNPLVDMITHPASMSNRLELKEVVKAAKEYDVILEINASSHKANKGRGNRELTRKLIELSLENGNILAVNSDAHYKDMVGDLSTLEPIIGDGIISNHDIINSNTEKIIEFLSKKNKVKLS